MEAVGARKQQGRRKADETFPTLGKVAEKLGIPVQTASRQLQAAEDYQAAAPELRVKVDAGGTSPTTPIGSRGRCLSLGHGPGDL